MDDFNKNNVFEHVTELAKEFDKGFGPGSRIYQSIYDESVDFIPNIDESGNYYLDIVSAKNIPVLLHITILGFAAVLKYYPNMNIKVRSTQWADTFQRDRPIYLREFEPFDKLGQIFYSKIAAGYYKLLALTLAQDYMIKYAVDRFTSDEELNYYIDEWIGYCDKYNLIESKAIMLRHIDQTGYDSDMSL